MHRAGLDENGSAGAAGVQRAMAIEALQALLRYAYQELVVIVRIVSVAAKMRVYAFDAGFIIALEPDPVSAPRRLH